MRSLLAILFSLALIATQAASVKGPGESGNQQAAASKCCGHCGPCKSASCCVAKNDSSRSQPAPAVPAPGHSQNDLQILVSVTLQLQPQSATVELPVPALSFVCASYAAPLYQRNCSYLI